MISEAGVSTDPDKISSIVHWPSPSNVKELRSFLGLAGYYRKFVRNYGIISKPLTSLLKKHQLFVWTSAHEQSFVDLKTALSTSPVILVAWCWWSGGIGAVLMQDGHPLAFLSRALGVKSRGLSTYEKEYMAILLAVQHWRSYLQYAEFLIFLLIIVVWLNCVISGRTLPGNRRYSPSF